MWWTAFRSSRGVTPESCTTIFDPLAPDSAWHVADRLPDAHLGAVVLGGGEELETESTFEAPAGWFRRWDSRDSLVSICDLGARCAIVSLAGPAAAGRAGRPAGRERAPQVPDAPGGAAGGAGDSNPGGLCGACGHRESVSSGRVRIRLGGPPKPADDLRSDPITRRPPAGVSLVPAWPKGRRSP